MFFWSKNRKNLRKKKVVRKNLKNLKFFIFFEFFSENVLKTLLRGQETTRKKYRIVFEKFTFYGKKSKKIVKKKCAKYFDFFFFRVFLRKCL